jgi:formyl-CoA transferase
MTPPAPPPAPPPGPLDGLVVLDLTQMLSGPFCTMILGDLGARIVKVEQPGRGDISRPTARLAGDDDPKGFGAYFASINRNKESVVVDLKQPGGRDVIRRLVPQVDILAENYRAGVMERLGLGYETLAALNPRLVYGAIRGFGDPRTGASPYADWPAFDVIAQAMGGMMGITGPRGGPPTKIGPGVGDLIPALYSVSGILAAVIRAARTGRGQFVDVAMMDAVMAVCERAIYQNTWFGEVPGPEGNRHPLICPFGMFPAADGHVAIGCMHDHFWAKLAEAMGVPEAGADPRYATNAARVRHRDEVDGMVAAWTARLTKAELARRLGGTVPVGPVNTAEDIVADPHTAARAMLAEVEQPGADGPRRIANTPLRFTESAAGVRHRAPLLGEHTDALLSEFGFTPAEIARLRAGGAVA